jgi:hypothetical protein
VLDLLVRTDPLPRPHTNNKTPTSTERGTQVTGLRGPNAAEPLWSNPGCAERLLGVLPNSHYAPQTEPLALPSPKGRLK